MLMTRLMILTLALSAAASVFGQIPVDDFSSWGDAAWSHIDDVAAFAGAPTTFDASTGAYVVTTAPVPTQAGYVTARAVWTTSQADLRFSQGTLRCKVRILNSDTNVTFFTRSNGVGNLTSAYSFFLEASSDLIGISRINPNPGGSYVGGAALGSFSMPINPMVDYMIEARNIGGSLSFKVWVDGTIPPGAPQVNVINSVYATGQFELAVYNIPSNTPGTPAALSAHFDDVSFLYPKPTASALYLPNGSTFVSNANLVPGREYWNVFSVEICTAGVGTGPYAGLCATDINTLLNQVLMPLGAEPFHYIPTGGSRGFGPYALPSGLSFDMIVFDLYAIDLSAVSNVFRVNVP